MVFCTRSTFSGAIYPWMEGRMVRILLAAVFFLVFVVTLILQGVIAVTLITAVFVAAVLYILPRLLWKFLPKGRRS